MSNRRALPCCLFVILMAATTVVNGQVRRSTVTQPHGIVGKGAPGQRLVQAVLPRPPIGFSDPLAEPVPAFDAPSHNPAAERLPPGAEAPVATAVRTEPADPSTAEHGKKAVEQTSQGCCYDTRPRSGAYGWFVEWKACMQHSHWGYAEYFQEPPLGTSLRAHMGAHVANGRASQMILYHFDFVVDGQDPRTSELNDFGRQRLWTMAKMLDSSCCPIIIQNTPEDPVVDANRRAFVLGQLANWGFAVPEERVVVGIPGHRGLGGDEAYLVHQNLLKQTQSGSPNLLGTSSSTYRGFSATPIGPSDQPR